MVLFQGAEAPKVSDDLMPTPVMPAGSNEAFQRLCLRMESELEKGDFEAASKTYKILPKLQIKIAWDDRNLPANRRAAYTEARDKAIQTWERSFPRAQVEIVPFKEGLRPAPQILFSFADKLPAQSGEPLPPAAVHFISDDPAEPRVEAVLSLVRGNPPVWTEFSDVHNEVAYAIMQYYGVERTLAFGSFAARTEVSTPTLAMPHPAERLQINENLAMVDALATAILKKKRLVPAAPKINFDPPSIDAGRATQGDLVPFSIQVTNIGTGVLQVKAFPDCACVQITRVSNIEPGETRLISGRFDLGEIYGFVDRSIVLYTNDLERPYARIPVKIDSKPYYRLLGENEGFVLMKPNGATHKVFLTLPETSKMTPLETRVDGITAKTTFKPWSGTLADPELKEGPMSRKGYVFEIQMPNEIPPGRSMMSLLIRTDNPRFPELQSNFFVQSGIIAMPEEIRFPQIAASPRRSSFVISRPMQGFKILKVESDSPFLTTSVEAVRDNWEYRVTVQFDGRAAPGPLDAVLTVFTDDSQQKTIKVPFRAMVK